MQFWFIWIDAKAPLADNNVGDMPWQYRDNVAAWIARYGSDYVKIVNGRQCCDAVRVASSLSRVDGLWEQYLAFANR